jgi:dipeptidyl aminopeptidase/acylaminoacyl peptidase
MRKLIAVAVFAAAVATTIAIPAAANPRGTNGRIAFGRDDPALGDVVVYTANPDGSHQQLLLPIGAEQPRWSPDGTLVKVNPHVEPDGSVAATIVNPDTGARRDLLNPDPARFDGMFCIAWSPDAARLACEGLSFSIDPTLNGIYTIRSSDGGGLQRVTSDPYGDDFPNDYSPNGKRLVFRRGSFSEDGFFTVKLNGSDLRRLTPVGMDMNFEPARWSPQGNEIVFSAHTPDGSYRSSIWAVHWDGSGLRQIPIASCGGAVSDPNSFGCTHPAWSPDGKKIIFARFSAATGDRDIFTVNADGSGPSQITDTPLSEELPDWGTHPLSP